MQTFWGLCNNLKYTDITLPLLIMMPHFVYYVPVKKGTIKLSKYSTVSTVSYV